MEKEKNIISWENRLSIHIPLIDSQHKLLIAMTNKLHEACKEGDESAKEQFMKTVSEVVAYVSYHFSTEEQIMEKTEYPGFQIHKKHHIEFVHQVLQNVGSFREGKKYVPNQFVRFLRDWILSHVAFMDSKLGQFIVNLQKMGQLGKIVIDDKDSKPVILAIDDSKQQLAMFKQMLPDYDLLACDTAIKGLEVLKRADIDLILLDLAMPEMSGFEFLQQLRNDPFTQKIPVIITSGHNTEKYILASKQFGAQDFIVKPAAPDLLNKKITAQLDKIGQNVLRVTPVAEKLV